VGKRYIHLPIFSTLGFDFWLSSRPTRNLAPGLVPNNYCTCTTRV